MIIKNHFLINHESF